MPRYTKNSPYAKSSAASTRICLKCLQPFASHGPGNRICTPCRQQESGLEKGRLVEQPPTPMPRYKPNSIRIY